MAPSTSPANDRGNTVEMSTPDPRMMPIMMRNPIPGMSMGTSSSTQINKL